MSFGRVPLGGWFCLPGVWARGHSGSSEVCCPGGQGRRQGSLKAKRGLLRRKLQARARRALPSQALWSNRCPRLFRSPSLLGVHCPFFTHTYKQGPPGVAWSFPLMYRASFGSSRGDTRTSEIQWADRAPWWDWITFLFPYGQWNGGSRGRLAFEKITEIKFSLHVEG